MKHIKIVAVLALVSVLVAGCGGAINSRIGGTVSGLSGGTSVVLVNNGMDSLTVSANGDFTFATSLAPGSNYNVTVSVQPTGQNCPITNGVGVVADSGGDVANIQVSCVAGTGSTSTVSASVSGLALGATVVLLNNGVNSLTVTGTAGTAAGGSLVQVFSTPLTAGANYSVTVAPGGQPVGQTCSVTNGTGQIPSTSGSTASPAIVTCM